MSRLLCSVVAVVALAVLMAGCGEEKPQGAGPRKYRVALVMKALANPFFKTMREGAEAHQKKNVETYELISNGIPDEQDVTKQIQIVRQMIADKVDAIVIAPADSKALVPVCKDALAAKIVVVNIDNPFDHETLAAEEVEIPFVGPDNQAGALLAGEYLAKRLVEGDEVVIVEGIRTANNAVMRKLGFKRSMDVGGMKVVTEQSANWETDQAQKLVANIAIEHPGLKAVLCANDSMALGAVSALDAAGKLDKVFVIGYDNIKAVQQLILQDKMLCTVDQHGDQIAAFGITHALDILESKSMGGDKKTGVDLVTAETLREK